MIRGKSHVENYFACQAKKKGLLIKPHVVKVWSQEGLRKDCTLNPKPDLKVDGLGFT